MHKRYMTLSLRTRVDSLSNKIVSYLLHINNRTMGLKVVFKDIAKKVVRRVPKTENKTDMIEEVKNIINSPSKKVKVEKSEKGLISRTDENVIVLNEDNKQLLND